MSAPDWSKLITVNYKGGLSGDFFSNLLADNFDDFNSKYVKNKEDKHKYLFANRDVFEHKIKSFSCFIDKRHPDIDSPVYSPFIPSRYEFYNTLHEMFKHESEEVAFKEIAELLYSLFYYKFSDGRYKVTNFHNVLQRTVALQSIFPGSKNIILTCDYSYFPLSRMLFFYKNLIDDYDKTVRITKATRDVFDEFITESFFIEPNYHKDKEHPVDIYQLIFCDKDYDEDLSEFLQTPVTLSKKQILRYRNDHIEIFKKLNVDPYKTYNEKQMRDIIIDMFRTDERFRFD
jgi:hypothetical protein